MVYNVWLIWLEDEISMIKSEKSYELEEAETEAQKMYDEHGQPGVRVCIVPAENSSSFMEEVKRMNTPYNGNYIN